MSFLNKYNKASKKPCTFINRYKKEDLLNYYYSKEFNEEQETFIYAVGKTKNEALITKTDAKGNVLWENTYTFDGLKKEKLSFHKIIQATYVKPLLAKKSKNQNQNHNLHTNLYVLLAKLDDKYFLVSIKNDDGSVQWAKEIIWPDNDIHINITGDRGSLYLAISDKNQRDSNKPPFVAMLDVAGNFIAGYNLNIPKDSFIINSIQGDDSHIVMGGRYIDEDSVGTIIRLNKNLDLIEAHSITDTYTTIQDVRLFQDEYLISGYDNNQEAIFVALIGGEGTHLKYIFPNSTNQNSTLQLGNNGFYLLQYTDLHAVLHKLDWKFKVLWTKEILVNNRNYGFRNFTFNESTERITFNPHDPSFETFVANTNEEMETCITNVLDKTELISENCTVQKIEIDFTAEEIVLKERYAKKTAISSEKIELCECDCSSDESLEMTDCASLQSRSLYLQSAGSLGEDSTKGIHLRWALKGALSAHLPKANYAIPNINFNKNEDFVKIYRAPYLETKVVLNFENSPNQINETINSKNWVYKIAEKVFYVHFNDIVKYNNVKYQLNVDPLNDPLEFLKNYGNALIEVENKTELSFAITPAFDSVTNPNNIRVELLSVEENKIAATKGASLRKDYSAQEINQTKLIAENIRSIRFSSQNSFVTQLEFEFYSDVLSTNLKTKSWAFIGKYALTTETQEAYNRLEPTTNCLSNWLHYNDGNTVNADNYKTKWDGTVEVENRLLEVVKSYINLSNIISNPTALETVYTNDISGMPNNNTENPNQPSTNSFQNSFEISNLHLLQMGSLDFHLARMLGLGHIDLDTIIFDGQYIYLSEYTTFGDLQDGLGAREVQHMYCSLPTALKDQRLPLPVELDKIKPGIFYNPDTNPDNPEPEVNQPLTDSGGLSHDGKTQFYTLFTKELPNEAVNANFYYKSDKFESSKCTIPVFAGLKYRKSTDTNWRKPELSFDSKYSYKNSAINETKPIVLPELGKPLYVHRERISGEYKYTTYGINWFSRASEMGEIVTIETNIKPANTLVPPTNVNSTLIQKESPLLLTTTSEQELFKAIVNDDKTLVRLTFEYNHAQELIDYHQKINGELIKGYVELDNDEEFFAEDLIINFRNQIPKSISGKIAQVSAGQNEVLLIVETSVYPIYSSGINETIVQQNSPVTATYKENYTPSLSAAVAPNFIGSIMLVDGIEYVIHEVDTSSTYPKFTIFKSDISGALVDMTNVVDPNNPLATPSVGSLFFIVENMQQEISWGKPNPSTFRINIDHTIVHREEEIVIKNTDGSTETRVQKFRGIYEEATITKISETVALNKDGVLDDILDNAADATNDVMVQKHLGLYKITFYKFHLNQHTQYKTNGENSVEWYNGIVRLHTWTGSDMDNQPRKIFKVIRTENIGTTANEDLILYIEDVTFPKNLSDPHYASDLDNYKGKLMADDATTIKQKVNYYPGYKVYLYEDTSIGLKSDNVLHATSNDVRYTMFSLQSHDAGLKLANNNTEENYSPYSAPSFMFAQTIEDPRRPTKLKGGLYATRPDFFGKSSYTFETFYAHKPHSVQFNRASDIQIISTLYANEKTSGNPNCITAQEIMEQFFKNEEELFYQALWENFLDFENTNTSFNIFIRTDESTVNLPLPNNPKLIESINDFIKQHNLFYHLTGNDAVFQITKISSLQQIIIPQHTNRNNELKFSDFMKDIVFNCFVPLTEIPIIYDYINEKDYKPIPKKQVVRDRNGQLLKPTDSDFDMAPMAVRYKNDEDQQTTQFTDFGLDGASNAKYFYAVREINKQMKTSTYSSIMGPISLINTAPPTAPEIIKVIPILENRTLGIPPAIQLQINAYPEIQNIRKINIYRADNAADAVSIRTMKLVKIIDLEVENLTNKGKWIFTDDFSDVPQVPFGDIMYYKLTVSRAIKYHDYAKQTLIDYVPSEASKLILTNIVENYSPESPEANYTADLYNPITDAALNHIILSWEEKVYKGNYHLYKMNAQGNWVEISKIIADRQAKGVFHSYNIDPVTGNWSNTIHAEPITLRDNILYLPLKITNLASDSLETKTTDGSPIYHHFKVLVENTSGMFSSKENILTMP